jgi:hypothetical protein
LQLAALMKRPPNPKLAMFAGLASLGLAGCSHPPRPIEASAAEAPSAFVKDRVDPRFRRALADYHRAVWAAGLLGEVSNDMALRHAVLTLSEALQVVPHGGLRARAAASELGASEARTAIAAPIAETSAIAHALRRADRALSDLAAGPYAAAPDVAEGAAELRQSVDRIELGRSLVRQRGLVLDALAQAERTLRAIEQALGRGQVS